MAVGYYPNAVSSISSDHVAGASEFVQLFSEHSTDQIGMIKSHIWHYKQMSISIEPYCIVRFPDHTHSIIWVKPRMEVLLAIKQNMKPVNEKDGILFEINVPWQDRGPAPCQVRAFHRQITRSIRLAIISVRGIPVTLPKRLWKGPEIPEPQRQRLPKAYKFGGKAMAAPESPNF